MLAFVERLAEREQLDLEACGEFLVLVSALLELKARGLFPEEEAELAELEPEEAAEELARRLAEYRRMKDAAGWLRDRLAAEGDRFFRLGPAPLAPRPRRRSRRRTRSSSPPRCALLAVEPPQVSLAHMALRFPPVAAVRRALPRRAAAPQRASTSTQEMAGLSRVEQAVAFLALLDLRRAGEITIDQAAPFAPIRLRAPEPSKGRTSVDRPLRLIAANPLDQLARTVEALLVVASAPLSVAELADGADDDAGARRDCARPARRALPRGAQRHRPRARRRRLGVPRVARRGRGLRAPLREAGRSAASRRRRSRRSRSSPTSGRARGPDIARIRGVAADSAVAGLARARPDRRGRPRRRVGGAIRYRTTPLFERVFGLESLSQLPRLDDLGDDAERSATGCTRSPRSARPEVGSQQRCAKVAADRRLRGLM